jgi:iron complex outermembrane recepter protein
LPRVYAYTDAQYDAFVENVGGAGVSRNGNRPTGVPAHVANLWLNYAVTPSWDAGAGARRVSSRFGNTANTVTAPGYTILDASISRRLQRNMSVTARDLTDRIYAAAITGTPMFFLGAPRSFDVALRVGLREVATSATAPE